MRVERTTGGHRRRAVRAAPRTSLLDQTGTVQPGRQVRRFYDEVWNDRRLDLVPEVLHPDLTFRGSLGPVRTGYQGFIDYVGEVHEALAGYHCEVEELVEDGSRVAARALFSGLHRGVLLGHAPTMKAVSWAGAAFFRFDGALARDIWVLGDVDGLRAQLAGPG
jgi:predicted ester cyclase